MTKAYRAIPVDETLETLSPERRRRIEARAEALIAEEVALSDLRRARRVTQEQVAERLGGRQVYVSRFEKRADIKLSTLRDYVRAIGGDLQLLVTFPDGETVRLKEIGEAAPRGAAARNARAAGRAGRTGIVRQERVTK